MQSIKVFLLASPTQNLLIPANYFKSIISAKQIEMSEGGEILFEGERAQLVYPLKNSSYCAVIHSGNFVVSKSPLWVVPLTKPPIAFELSDEDLTWKENGKQVVIQQMGQEAIIADLL